MKKLYISVLLAAVIAAPFGFTGCDPESITIVDLEEVDPEDTEPDDGTGEFTIESADADLTDFDNVGAVTFHRKIEIVWDGESATVSEPGDSITVSISGGGVTINHLSQDRIIYELRGSSSNGFFKLYSVRKQAIVLNGVSLTNPSGAAINNQSHKRTFVVVRGENTLKDGSSYSTVSDEDLKAAFFSEGQLVFSGDGSLTVTAQGKAAITSDDYIRFMSSPTVIASSSAGHGIRGKDGVIVSNGTLDISVSAAMKKGISSDENIQFDGGSTTIKVTGGAGYDSDGKDYDGTAGVKTDKDFVMNGGSLTITNSGQGGKGISADGKGTFAGGTVKVDVTGSNYSKGDISAKGIKADGALVFSGSTVEVTAASHEAIESNSTITVSGGDVYAYSTSDDAINSKSTFTVTGGILTGISTGNDGLDANGNFNISGGIVFVASKGSPEVGVDANTEGGYKLTLTGGTIFAIGGLERGSTLSQSCYQASSWNKNTWYTMTVGSDTYSFKTPSVSGTPLVVSGASTPTLKSGTSVSGGTECAAGRIVLGGEVSGGSAVTLSSYTSSSGGGPGGGGGRPRW
ncbi:MAG: carbohydrate-binding domain-containing protein [Bacteroidales bacterium]|nr:carbohydrate-binding domain-containing protein [Bacteroidales bacterium]